MWCSPDDMHRLTALRARALRMQGLAGIARQEIIAVGRKLGERQPGFGNFQKQKSVPWRRRPGQAQAFIGTAVVVSPSAHGLTPMDLAYCPLAILLGAAPDVRRQAMRPCATKRA